MKEKKTYLAVDLGAGSGRVLAGEFDGERIDLRELHRFDNVPVHLPSGHHWNITALYQEILVALWKAGETFGGGVTSIGIDTWGVDYGLLDKQGRLLGLPYQYRDSRIDGVPERVEKRVSLREIYQETGIQHMPFNTIFQLYAEREGFEDVLDCAEDLLFIPDLLGFWLTGNRVQERSIASTSQLYDPQKNDWNFDLIGKLGLPRHLFKKIVDPGTSLGPLRGALAEKTGLKGVKVVSVGGHDTASAVAAVPGSDNVPAYLSSGTWSLLGLEIDQPIINDRSCEDQFTNEVGLGGKIRFLRNICGLWLIQECRRSWLAAREDVPYARMAQLASESAPFRSLIDPDDPLFTAEGNMVARIKAYCKESGQPVPETKGEVIRCIYESLALRYAEVWSKLSAYSDPTPKILHVVGGGCQDKMLNEFTADATGLPASAGPVEATGLGNILAQMLSDGVIGSLEEGRKVVLNSSLFETFEPRDKQVWIDQRDRFAAISAHQPYDPGDWDI